MVYFKKYKGRVDFMDSKEKVLEFLAKYGFDSKYNDPYLYEQQGKYGLVYIFSHAFYGLLTRVVFFDQEKELDQFLYQYWWYKKYGKDYNVSLELDDYESLETHPKFFYQEKEISVKDMKKILIHPDSLSKEKKSIRLYERLLRTSKMLLEAIQLKVQMKKDTVLNVRDLQQELQRQENEFLQLYHKYQKKDFTKKELEISENEFIIPHEVEDFKLQFDWFMKHENEEDLNSFLHSLWTFLFELESDFEHLKNKYLLIKLPLDLNDIKKKKDYMESLFNKKKGLFSKKDQPKVELQKIEKESEIHKIVKMEDYIKNEKQRLEEKYSIVADMDLATLGDYLNEFDNLGIEIPFTPKQEGTVHSYSHQELCQSLNEIYDQLSIQEQQCLNIYQSFLRSLCDEILKRLLNKQNETEIVSYLVTNYMDEIKKYMAALLDAENVLIRMKKMKLISVSNANSFCMSLIEVCKTLLTIQVFQLPGNCYVFGKSLINTSSFDLYHASCKSIGSPTQTSEGFDIHDILFLHENVSFWFFPTSFVLKDPYFHDFTIQEKNNCEDILLNFQNYEVNIPDSAIIKVSRYQIDRNLKIVKQIRLLSMDQYRIIQVKGR